MERGGLRLKKIVKTSALNNPLISVVTVVYNGESTLEQTIKSVVNQTYNNIEYIIIDGDSEDGTLDIIKRYDEVIDYWQSESDSGIYDAMNKALDLANGDFLIFLGADDCFFQNNTISLCLEKLKADSLNYGVVYFRNHPYIYWGKFLKTQIFYQNICHQAIFYPKNFYKKYKYNLQYKIYADWEMNIKAYSKCKFNYLPIVISIFNEVGASSVKKDDFKRDKKKIIITNFGFIHYIIYLLYVPVFIFRRLLKLYLLKILRLK